MIEREEKEGTPVSEHWLLQLDVEIARLENVSALLRERYRTNGGGA